MATPTFVFGHKNPDTDSICSAIAYTELKKKLGYEDIYAYRLGEVNKETQFVLDYFGVKAPPLLTDIKVKLKDLGLYNPVPLAETDPIIKAWSTLKASIGSRIMPVVDSKGMLLGVISNSDISKVFMEVNYEDILQKYEVGYESLLKVLNAEVFCGEYGYDYLMGKLFLGISNENLASLTDKDVVITENIEEAKKIAESSNCGLIILTNGVKPIEKTKTPIVCVKHKTFKAVTLINHAVTVRSILKKQKITAFSTENNIEDISGIMKTSTHRNFPVVNRDGRLVGVISRRHLIENTQRQVILVDHNERSQSVAGLEQANIIEVIDHHRFADIQTDSPLFIRSEPIGSTATIIYKMYVENSIKPTIKMAGIMLSAIISDTLLFTSPTCTSADRSAAERLAKIAGVKIEEYASKMYSTSTSMANYEPAQILELDRKQFSFDKYLVYISQIISLDFKSIVEKREELIKAMETFARKNKCDLVILMVTDIVLGGSEFIVVGKAKELAAKAFGMEYDELSIFLPGVISRKKQVVPKLSVANQML